MTEVDPATLSATPPALVVDAALVRAHQGAVWRYLRVLGAACEEATDLAQEVFVVLLRDSLRGALRDRGHAPLRAWLRTTARNLFLAHCRRVRRSPIALDGDAVERAWVEYERDDDGAGYRDALDRCLETLSPRQREVLEASLRREPHAGAPTHTDAHTDAAAPANARSAEGTRSWLRRLKHALRDCVLRRLRDEH